MAVKKVKRIAKRVVKKAPAEKAPVTKRAIKKSVKKTVTKKTAVKKAAKKTTARRPPIREMNEHGFVVGTDSAFISEALVEGGETRIDVMHAISEQLESVTRGGNEKNVSSLISAILRKMYANGYTVEASWRVVPSVAGSAPKRKTTPAKITKKPVKSVTRKPRKVSKAK